MGRPYGIITFDCYGTLIDWESGISAAFAKAAARNLSTKMRQWVLEFSVAAAPPLWRAAPLASGPAPREAGGPQADTFWKGRETMI